MLLGGGGTWDEACTKNIAGFNLWLQLRRIGQGAVAYQGTDSGAMCSLLVSNRRAVAVKGA